MANTTQDIENLAAQIGDNIYIDVAKWHLYLREAHLHSVVAEKVFPLLENNSLSENAVMSILREIKVTLGGGHLQVSLADLLPSKCQIDLIDLLEEAVMADEKGMLSVAYGNTVGLLVEAIKEQQSQIEQLKNEISLLKGNR